MKYFGKKLPKGFTYMLNKKDITEINAFIGNYIESVYLDGISYSESKMYKNWSLSKNAIRIKYINEDGRLLIDIKLYGMRFSNFKDKEDFTVQKESIKSELIEKFDIAITKYKQNTLTYNNDYIWLRKN